MEETLLKKLIEHIEETFLDIRELSIIKRNRGIWNAHKLMAIVIKLLSRAEEKLRSMINDPNSHMGACPILLYSCIIEILLVLFVLSYINKRKVTMKELAEN